MPKATKKAVTLWLEAMALRLPVTMSVDETKAHIAKLRDILVFRFPAGAFTSRALDHVITAHGKWATFPNDAELCAEIDTWWRENNPDKPRGFDHDVEASSLDDAGKRWVMSYRERRNHSPEAGALMLSLMRAKHPAAYDWTVRGDLDAAATAVRRGWSTPGVYSGRYWEAEWDDPVGIQRHVATVLEQKREGGYYPFAGVCLRLLHGLVFKWAPQHLHLVPDSLPLIIPVYEGDIVPPVVAGLFGE